MEQKWAGMEHRMLNVMDFYLILFSKYKKLSQFSNPNLDLKCF